MLKPDPTITRLGPCSICKGRADYNSPAVDPSRGLQESPLYCDVCRKDQPLYLIGIRQHLKNGKRQWDTQGTHSKKSIIAHTSGPETDATIHSAWFDNGRIAIPRSVISKLSSQYPSSVEQVLDHLFSTWESGSLYCTGCDQPLKREEVAGFPLFAGAVCSSCWQDHKAHIEKQRAAGHICRMCRQPYALCCC